MARELYNWDQLRAYAVLALWSLIKKRKKINLINFIRELDTFQTRYGKAGVIGLANRYLNEEKEEKTDD